MKERIQKIIAARGVASRRHAEQMIIDGRVTCNGAVCKLGDSADPSIDEIMIDGSVLPEKDPFVYIMLNKPRGFVTTLSDEKGRKTVAQLVSDCGCRVYPVGRLDMDSEGLLLMTNDGDLANRIMHPSHEVKKTYRVSLRNFSMEALERLKHPMTLDGYRLKIPGVVLLERTQDSDKAIVEITIHEGRNRQVRRMCAIAGMDVVRLTRVREGNLTLGKLQPGKWRYLNENEIAQLKSLNHESHD